MFLQRLPEFLAAHAMLAGLFIAQVCRLIGQPLAPWRGEDVPVTVAVHTDKDGSLVWDRLYRFPRRDRLPSAMAPLLIG